MSDLTAPYAFQHSYLQEHTRAQSLFDLCNIQPGDKAGRDRDVKHFCFHWELNHGLNLDLKQRYVYETVKGSI